MQDLTLLTYMDAVKIFLSATKGRKNEGTKKGENIRNATQEDIDAFLR